MGGVPCTLPVSPVCRGVTVDCVRVRAVLWLCPAYVRSLSALCQDPSSSIPCTWVHRPWTREMILSQQIRHLNWKGPHFRSRMQFLENSRVESAKPADGYLYAALPSFLFTCVTHLVEILHSDSESTRLLRTCCPVKRVVPLFTYCSANHLLEPAGSFHL